MRRTGRMRAPMLEHFVTVEDVNEDEYNRLMTFVKENVSTTERNTPKFREPSFDDERPTKLTFRFRDEAKAMAFKLIL